MPLFLKFIENWFVRLWETYIFTWMGVCFKNCMCLLLSHIFCVWSVLRKHCLSFVQICLNLVYASTKCRATYNYRKSIMNNKIVILFGQHIYRGTWNLNIFFLKFYFSFLGQRCEKCMTKLNLKIQFTETILGNENFQIKTNWPCLYLMFVKLEKKKKFSSSTSLSLSALSSEWMNASLLLLCVNNGNRVKGSRRNAKLLELMLLC